MTRLEILENYSNGFINRSELINQLIELIITQYNCANWYSTIIWRRMSYRYKWSNLESSL